MLNTNVRQDKQYLPDMIIIWEIMISTYSTPTFPIWFGQARSGFLWKSEC